MIMGMEVHPFDRLARAVDEVQAAGAVGEDFFVQLGSCGYEPRHARHVRYLPFDEVRRCVEEASVVITHAGAGSTLLCIQQGKHPIMVPRRARWGEHVDDHQLPFTAKLVEGGLATALEDVATLPEVIASVRGRSSAPAGAIRRATGLTRWLESYWQEVAARRASRASS